MTRTGICGWLLVACATLTPLPSVEAQAGPSFGGDLVEITEPVLEGLVRGLRAEIALQKEFRDLLAKYPTQEQYNACGAQVATSEEAMKLLELMNLPENATPEQSQRAMQKFTTETAALHKRKCPFDPNEWNSSTKAKRLKEIEAKAAEAAGSSSPAGVYPLLKERIVAFCMSDLAPNTNLSVTPVQVPGTGNKIYFVYTAAEAKALQAKCSQLMGPMSQLTPA